jgi:hypothetical protein
MLLKERAARHSRFFGIARRDIPRACEESRGSLGPVDSELPVQTDAEGRRSFSQLAELAATVSVWNLYRPLLVVALDEVVARFVGIWREYLI